MNYISMSNSEGGEHMARLLRANQAAQKIDVTVDRLYDYSRQGIVPVVRIGRQVRWSEEALDDFISNGGQSFPGGWKKDN